MTYGPDFTNLANIQARTITWNADNMPTQITHSSNITTQLTYGGAGERVKKRVYSGGIVTDTYYIGDHFEVKGGVTIKYIFAGNLRVAQVKGATRSFFHKDHLGSSTLMTNASGAELESTEYMPFGSQRSHSGTNTSDYRFTDQELDAENGLYNYNARLYDPFIGRFISADTIVPQPFNPQSLNRYTYCLNNPLIYTDPSGHISILYDVKKLTYEEWQACLEFEKYILINELYGRKLDPSLYLTGFEMTFPDPDTIILTSLLAGAWSPEVVSPYLCGDSIGREIVRYTSGYEIYSVNKYTLQRDYNDGTRKYFKATGFISHENKELGIYSNLSNEKAAQVVFHEGVHAWQNGTNNARSWSRGEREFEAIYMEVEFALRSDLIPRNPDFVMIDNYGNRVPNPYAIQKSVDQYEGSGIGYTDTILDRDINGGRINFTCPK